MRRESELTITLFTLGGPMVVFLSATNGSVSTQAEVLGPISALTRRTTVQRRSFTDLRKLHSVWVIRVQFISLQWLKAPLCPGPGPGREGRCRRGRGAAAATAWPSRQRPAARPRPPACRGRGATAGARAAGPAAGGPGGSPHTRSLAAAAAEGKPDAIGGRLSNDGGGGDGGCRPAPLLLLC